MFKRKASYLTLSLFVTWVFLFASFSLLQHSQAAAYETQTPAALNTIAPGRLPGQAITQTWKNLGLYGGVIGAIAVDPSTNVPTGTVYAGATAGSGLYRSDDGGVTWSGVYTPASVQALGIDTVHGIVWARGNQVITSADRGQTWYPVSLPPGLNVMPEIVVSGSLVFVGSGRTVARSDDAGATWVTATLPAGGNQSGLKLALDVLGDRVFAATYDEIYRSPISPMNFITSSGGTTSSHGIENITAIGVSPYVADEVFVGTGDLGQRALYRSTDAGATWTQVFSNAAYVGYVAFHPAYTQTVYAGGRQSTNGGVTFVDMAPGAGNSALAIYPTAPYTMFGAIEQGINRSIDGGASFQPVNTGIEGVVVQQIAQNPRDLGLYFVNTKSGLGRTFDGGQDWDFPLSAASHFGGAALAPYYSVTDTAKVFLGEVASDNYADTLLNLGTPSLRSLIEAAGCTGQCAATINALAADPADADHLYAASGGFHIPPGGNKELALGGMWESTDGGTTWTQNTVDYSASYGTLPYTTPVNSVLFADAGLAYAALGDRRNGTALAPGIYGGVISRTTGGNWQLVATSGRPITSVVEALAVDPNNPQHIWVGTGEPVPGLFSSSDGGVTWQDRTPPGAGGNGFQAVAIHPRAPSVVLAASREKVFFTDNSGLTWTLISAPPVAAEAVNCILLPLLPPKPVQNLTGTVGAGTVTLSWVPPLDPRFQGVHIRGDGTNAPRTSIEGTAFVTLTATQVSTTISLPSTPYYFTVFPYDSQGRYGIGVKVKVSGGSVTPAGTGPSGDVRILNGAEIARTASDTEENYVLAGTGTGLYRMALGKFNIPQPVYLPLVLK